MSEQLVVRPDAYRQFIDPQDTFVLVTDADSASQFVFASDPGQRAAGKLGSQNTVIVPVSGADTLSDVISSLPAAADVLVICRSAFITSPDSDVIGEGRRIVVMPCASTPVSLGQIRYFLDVMAKTDPGTQSARAERFFEAIEVGDVLRLVDDRQGSVCEFDVSDEGYVWNQQAGYLDPGEQQVAPAGELSVLPMEITDFDASRRLALNGSLTLHGPPIVHAGYDPSLVGPQAALYAQLAPLCQHPVVLALDHGAVTACRPGTPTAEAAELAAVFDALFVTDGNYRTIWELGFGINTDMHTVPANCGLNEPYGSTDGVVHVGLGLTPYTRFALTFLCPATTIVGASDSTVLGAASGTSATAPERRIKRVRGTSCGCFPGGDATRSATDKVGRPASIRKVLTDDEDDQP